MTTIAVPGGVATRPSGSRLHTFLALFARDLRVARRDIVSFGIRAIMQPALFVFVFSYVLPRIGAHGGASPFAAKHPGAAAFSTILVPGLVATSIMVQGLLAVTAPLMMELSYTREIEDRVLAPIPAWLLGVEKIAAGTVQALIAGIVVFPFVILIHAKGQAPALDFSRWPLLAAVMLLAAGFTSAFAMFLGMVIDPRKLSTIFAVIVVPMTMLGCVYYPWEQLRVVPWLQWVVLANPLVYISEALRTALTPGVPHIRTWVLLVVLFGGIILTVTIASRAFVRRVID
jgi:ABC-2 type transport system permease protein